MAIVFSDHDILLNQSKSVSEQKKVGKEVPGTSKSQTSTEVIYKATGLILLLFPRLRNHVFRNHLESFTYSKDANALSLSPGRQG